MSLPTESLILVSGLPGHGKTLYAVHLAKQYVESGTRVFSWGLDGANSDLFEVLPEDWSFSDWQKLPAGSVVIFDEAHKLLPTRTAGAPPKSISDLTEIRHFGLRFIFITQDPRNLDVFVRRLIGRHFHITRKMGFPGAIVRSFDKCADDPNDFHAQKNSTSELWKYPKDLFKLYTSATMHLVKPKVPKKVILYSLIAVLGLGFATYVFFTYAGKVQDGTIVPGSDSVSETSSFGDSSSAVSVEYSTAEEYVEAVTPLLEVAPWTAPIYAEVRKVERIPDKPVCYIGSRGCRCFSDQMTRIYIPEVVCESIVRDGIYSPYHQPYASAGAQGRSAEPAPADGSGSSSFITHNGRDVGPPVSSN